MLDRLSLESLEELGRALHERLNAPPTAATRRVKALGPLTKLLEEVPQFPGDLPYVPRNLYDERRAAQPSAGPPSARLQEQFGSWTRACHAAWGLRDDGRSWGPGEPWARPPRRPKNYSAEEATASVRACAAAIGRIPTSQDYHVWVMNSRRRARSSGQDTRPLVHYSSVMRLLAPDRMRGNGWQLVLSRVFEPTLPRPST
jgi:hypothetical protein